MATVDGLPRVLFNNEFENATSVVASTEAVGFEGANAYDWRMNTFWMPTASGSTLTATFAAPVTVDSFGIFKHTLAAAGATLFLEHDDTGFVTDLTITPADDIAIMKTFTPASSTIWRIRVTYAGDAPTIGTAAFGEFLEFERGIATGYASPNLSDIPDILNSVTQGGNIIGRSILSNKNQSDMSINHMSETFARDSWDPFVKHMQLKPFFMLWLERDFPEEAAFCWTEGTPPARAYVKNKFISHNIKLNQRIN